MFDTIILLTDPVEQGPLSAALLRHNPHLALHAVTALDDLNALPPRLLRRARLVAFASPFVVPRHVLSRLGYGAYNFHPGPPSYPGWAPAQFAIYDGAASFGVTVNVMHERVDSGPIVAVDLFDVPAAATAETLETLAYTRLARQYFALVEPLATNPHALPALPIQWCGRKGTRRRCAELCEIPLDIGHDELARRIAAFGDGRLGVAPTLALHGHRFRLVDTEAAPSLTAAEPAITAVPA